MNTARLLRKAFGLNHRSRRINVAPMNSSSVISINPYSCTQTEREREGERERERERCTHNQSSTGQIRMHATCDWKKTLFCSFKNIEYDRTTPSHILKVYNPHQLIRYLAFCERWLLKNCHAHNGKTDQEHHPVEQRVMDDFICHSRHYPFRLTGEFFIIFSLSD